MFGPYRALGSRCNFGWGRDLAYAGHCALKFRAGNGHYSTVATHSERFGQFAAFAKTELGIRDLSKHDPQAALEAYARDLSKRFNEDELSKYGLGRMQPSYAHNLICSAQVALRAITGDTSIGVSPSRYIGARVHVRHTAPTSLNRAICEFAVEEMRARGLVRAAAVASLCRQFGMRRREAALADLDRLSLECQTLGMVNILDGTKGGRRAPRWVHAAPRAMAVLKAAIAARPAASRNLLASDESWREFKDGELKRGLRCLESKAIAGYRDLRAGYACERYKGLTGYDAPCVSGCAPVDRKKDQMARDVLAYELGHGRRDITAAYAGGTRGQP